MKKLAGILLLLAGMAGKAQDGPPPPPDKEMHQKHMDMMQKELQLDQSQQAQFQQVMKEFMDRAEEIHKNNPPPPPPPPDPTVKAAMDKIVKERNDKLKTILNTDQYNKFLEQEKMMHHPPMPPGDHQGQQPPKIKS